MNDRYFVEELVAYLEREEILDKKKYVKTIYERDIDNEEYNDLKGKFTKIIDKIHHLSSNIFPINNTRYKQRADFYTLFNFIHKHSIEIDILEEMYKILVVIADDISPSNDDCEVLQNYANNCVSQSNSKIARNNRLVFFENLLLNKSKEGNKTLKEMINYFVSFYNIENIKLNKLNEYYLIDYSKIDEEKNILVK